MVVRCIRCRWRSRRAESLSAVENLGKFDFSKKVLLFKVEGLGLMRIIGGMQRLFRCEDLKKSFSKGIGITVPKARARDKLLGRV